MLHPRINDFDEWSTTFMIHPRINCGLYLSDRGLKAEPQPQGGEGSGEGGQVFFGEIGQFGSFFGDVGEIVEVIFGGFE